MTNSCFISDVIPLVKKLNFQVESVVVSGIGTFKSFFKLEMKKYFDDKYKIESRKEYSIATLVDPRYKSAGFWGSF